MIDPDNLRGNRRKCGRFAPHKKKGRYPGRGRYTEIYQYSPLATVSGGVSSAGGDELPSLKKRASAACPHYPRADLPIDSISTPPAAAFSELIDP